MARRSIKRRKREMKLGDDKRSVNRRYTPEIFTTKEIRDRQAQAQASRKHDINKAST